MISPWPGAERGLHRRMVQMMEDYTEHVAYTKTLGKANPG